MRGVDLLVFEPGLYVSSDLREQKRKLCEGIMQGNLPNDLFIIYKSEYSGKPEFMRSKDLKQKYFQERTVRVVGITKDYQAALEYLACEAYNRLEG